MRQKKFPKKIYTSIQHTVFNGTIGNLKKKWVKPGTEVHRPAGAFAGWAWPHVPTGTAPALARTRTPRAIGLGRPEARVATDLSSKSWGRPPCPAPRAPHRHRAASPLPPRLRADGMPTAVTVDEGEAATRTRAIRFWNSTAIPVLEVHTHY